jgi:hypothetical protein
MILQVMPLKPVDGEITPNGGEFGAEREGKELGHNGIDYRVPIGTPVKASLDGVVVRANHAEASAKDKDGRSYGWIIVLYHGQNSKTGAYTYTLYAHLNNFADGLKVGSKVKRGEEIARSGNSGRVRAHLHFETIESWTELDMATPGKVEYNDHRVNPLVFLNGLFYYNELYAWTAEKIKKIKDHCDVKAIRERNKGIVGFDVYLGGKKVGYSDVRGSVIDVKLSIRELEELLSRPPALRRWSKEIGYEIKLAH